ncbi:uncharacterized protein ASCRUDRAFT_75908 [Ascoidea rubescens DSM 1968]|uniref:Amino acid permease/ SLC12A domain-containing protein n=1 Tax=Ascoidea rubescens DSM 1968 TaxID=1344418 RepID=A0A1D2VI89_9ASCO|nr:hypothetical protein ASCRUDRAFT_75908 [Ascoidea rubescens DSM 1968]ODV61197.1 hypothetical protein ASCRUDRAFT_75908 [Ascoidea rubescens DSM 1968]
MNSKEGYGIEVKNESSSIHDEPASGEVTEVAYDYHKSHTKRRLESRHVQLIAIGGSIGSALFISIGIALVRGGPGSLFLSFFLWSAVFLLVIASCGEMVSYLPVDSPFITIAGRVIDPAFEAAVGYNFYIMEAIYIPYEITAVNGMIHFWRNDYSPAITFCIQIVMYTVLNVFAVQWYGESEFWLSLGKLLLAVGLLCFSFIAMVGGNPQRDAFGFRYWRDPGAFAEYLATGTLGRFEGFLAGAMFIAVFTIVGAEYISMIAGETINPRKVMPRAFKTFFYRLVFFYIGGAISVGVLVPYNDANLLYKMSTTSGGDATVSPYVVAMENLGITVLPHIVNALCLTSAFSAGNSYLYCSSRCLYGLALKGYAPKWFAICNKQGVPIYGVALGVGFSLLSLLQLGSGTATVFNWLVSLCSGAQVLNFSFMCVTYLGFYRACKAQGIDRNSFTYKGWGQPYTAMVGLFFTFVMVILLGYTNFLPGMWSIENFLYDYLMLFISIFVFCMWKLVFKTKFVKPEEADLVSGLREIEEHEIKYYQELETRNKKDLNMVQRVLDWIFG